MLGTEEAIIGCCSLIDPGLRGVSGQKEEEEKSISDFMTQPAHASQGPSSSFVENTKDLSYFEGTLATYHMHISFGRNR